jgi:hypothetical protein
MCSTFHKYTAGPDGGVEYSGLSTEKNTGFERVIMELMELSATVKVQFVMSETSSHKPLDQMGLAGTACRQNTPCDCPVELRTARVTCILCCSSSHEPYCIYTVYIQHLTNVQCTFKPKYIIKKYNHE